MSPVFRAYISPDVLGIELGGALKNVIALAAGAADGLGYGDNTKAALITRGITEITRLGIAMGAKAETFYGLSGIGDLIVTCASKHSRNRRAGILLGQGKTMEEAMKEVKMVVEGVYSAKAGWELSQKYQVDTPIIQQVNQVLFDGKEPGLAVQDLMLRDKKIESWEVFLGIKNKKEVFSQRRIKSERLSSLRKDLFYKCWYVQGKSLFHTGSLFCG